jgi:protein SCO1/2
MVFALFFCCLTSAAASAVDPTTSYDRDAALELSQAAIGTSLGDYVLTDMQGNEISLHDFRGKPLLISMIFTSCHHICPTTTQHINTSTKVAAEVLGAESFEIVSVGFDTRNDTPDALRAFAREQGIDASNWKFLSASADTIDALSRELGFQFFPSPRGFDHLNQLTIIDRDGKVYSQVYGMRFELPWLVEPLKQLVFNRPESQGHVFAGLLDRVRLFCTVYNPATGRYEFDNSLFFQIAAGFIVIFSISFYLWRESRRARRV